MKRFLTVAVVAAAAVVTMAGQRAARADASGYGELVIGPMVELGDSSYVGLVKPSLKLGFHTGYLPPDLTKQKLRWGFELAGDYTGYRDDYVDPKGARTIDFYRIRLQLGVRAIYEYKPRWFLFSRVLAGIDIWSTDTTGMLAGVDYNDTDVDLGMAMELGGGLLVDVGEWSVGGQIDFPVAIQRSGGIRDVSAFDAKWLGVDVDLLFTAALPL